MSTDVLLLVVYVAGALGISFLCSILEATLLSARLSELLHRAEKGDRGAARLLELKRERVDDAISAVLTLNTLAHTVGATLAGAQAAKVFGSAWVGVFSGVLTLLVLIFTEIIPKTLGTVHASRLVGFVGRTVGLLTVALAPLVAASRALTRLIAHGKRPAISRAELATLVTTAAREGAIPAQESRVLANVLRYEKVRVEDVMTPRTVAVMLPASLGLAAFVEDPRTEPYSRFPVFDGNPDHILGYVLHRELLRALVQGADPSTPLRDFVRDGSVLPESASLPAALRTFLENREHMAVVVDEFGGVAGLVTLEDVVETILGTEIVDESDEVTDLRALASEVRDRRLARLQHELVEKIAPEASAEPEASDREPHDDRTANGRATGGDAGDRDDTEATERDADEGRG